MVAADMRSRWAHRRKIDPAAAARRDWHSDRPLCMGLPERRRGLPGAGLAMPRVSSAATSGAASRPSRSRPVRLVTPLSLSLVLRLNAGRHSLKVLPVDSANPRIPGCHPDPEETESEPAGRALHRARPGGRKIDAAPRSVSSHRRRLSRYRRRDHARVAPATWLSATLPRNAAPGILSDARNDATN